MPHEPSNGSSRIHALILDYGQVLARTPRREDFGRMAEMFNVSFERFYSLWRSTRLPYDRGDLAAEEYWLRLAAATDTVLSGEQIERLRKIEVEIWSHPDPAMLDWVSRLHSAGWITALLSNMPCDLFTHLRTNCRWMDDFNFKTFSAEVRLLKPDPAIYEHTLRGMGVSASETLFVDDHEPNVIAARALGMHAIQFQSVGQLAHDLQTLGFSILPGTLGTPRPAASKQRSPKISSSDSESIDTPE